MLSVSPQSPVHKPQKRSVSFTPEVNAKEEKNAIREDRKNVTNLLLQSRVAFIVDKSHAVHLLQDAKKIIDKRFPDDKDLMLTYNSKAGHLRK